jgi:hypothetical protein
MKVHQSNKVKVDLPIIYSIFTDKDVVYDLLSNHNQIGNIMSSRMTATELATM